MRVFLLDLWLDLKAKRLAPLAIALLAAIVAVPIVLAKGNDDSTPPPPAKTATTASAGAVVVESQREATATNSKLQTFSSRDPFEPTSSKSSSSGSSSGSGSSSDAETATSSTGTTENQPQPSSSASETTSSVTSGGDTGGGTTGGGTTGGGTTGSTGTGTTGTGTTGTTTPEQKTTLYTYTVDVKFGTGGDVPTYKNVKRLALVPDQDNAKVVFLGVTTTGKTAVFLVDGSLGVDTDEGRCRPSPDECTFLYLRPDKDHDQAVLTDSDGTVYHIRVLDINRVSVSSANGTTGTGNSGGTTKSHRAPAFTGRVKLPDDDTPAGEPSQRRAFQQFFADSGK